MHFFSVFSYIFVFWGFLYLDIKLNIISLNHILVRCPSLERDWSSGDHVPIPGWVTPQIFIHTVSVVSGSATQQQTVHMTSPAGMVYTFSFSFVLVCLVLIDPVQHGDAQLSHPFYQVRAAPVTVWYSGLAILCVVMCVPVCSQTCIDHQSKGKVVYGQEPPSGESTTTECGFNYQLLVVITEVAQWELLVAVNQQPATDNGVRDDRSNWQVTPPPYTGQYPLSSTCCTLQMRAANRKTCCTESAANVWLQNARPTHCRCGHSGYKKTQNTKKLYAGSTQGIPLSVLGWEHHPCYQLTCTSGGCFPMCI